MSKKTVIIPIALCLFLSLSFEAYGQQDRCYAETKRMLFKQKKFFLRNARRAGWTSEWSRDYREAVIPDIDDQRLSIDSRCNNKLVQQCRNQVRAKKAAAIRKGVKFTTREANMLAARCRQYKGKRR